MRTVFYGTPALAVPYLDLLARRTQVAAVLTSPDQPSGRSLRVQPTPVKVRALELGLPVLQPERPAAAVPQLTELKPELAVVVAYGKLLPGSLLAVPVLGSLNVHFSLLPRYRGAAPVQWSLVRGETRTGVSLFWLDAGLDTGPLLLQRDQEIGPDEDAAGLFARLGELGLQALDQALGEVAAGRVLRQAQVGEPSLAPRLRKEDGRLSLTRPAAALHNLVRGLRLWPTAYLELAAPTPQRVRVLRTALPDPSVPPAERPPGTIVRVERGGGILIQCSGRSSLWILTVQPEGKKPVAAADFLNGLRLGVGDLLPLA